jgi:tetratricopeptide (TPR) repeat protein
LSLKTKNRHAEASALGNLAAVYHLKKDMRTAQDYCFRAIQLHEELGDLEGQANMLNTISAIDLEENNLPEAKRSLERAMLINESINDKSALATNMHNLGVVTRLQGAFEVALTYFQLSLQIRREINDFHGLATTIHEMARDWKFPGPKDGRDELLREALKISQQFHFDLESKITVLLNEGFDE